MSVVDTNDWVGINCKERNQAPDPHAILTEGLVLKASESRYNDPYLRWVKLKVRSAARQLLRYQCLTEVDTGRLHTWPRRRGRLASHCGGMGQRSRQRAQR